MEANRVSRALAVVAIMFCPTVWCRADPVYLSLDASAAEPPVVRSRSHSRQDLFWVSADYLHTWTRGASLPPLLAENPVDTGIGQIGVPSAPSTELLFGGESVLDSGQSGWRMRGGVWLDDCQQCGIEFDYLKTGSQDTSRQVGGNGNPIYSRPFTDAETGRPSAELISYLGLASGHADAFAGSSGLESWGLGLRRCLARCCCGCRSERLDMILGYRHYETDDIVSIQEQLASPLFGGGTMLALRDEFATVNRFDGGEIGLQYERRRCRWQLRMLAKIALGARHGRIRIDGETNVTSSLSAPLDHAGGFYALPSNMGSHGFSDFSAVYQTEVELQYWLTRRITLDVGYLFILWPDLYRAGDQIDTTINPNLLPPPVSPLVGPVRPTVPYEESTFWAQGLQIGMTYRF